MYTPTQIHNESKVRNALLMTRSIFCIDKNEVHLINTH